MKREKLRQARITKGLSQKVAAELMGVSRNAWSLWELGKEDPYPVNVKELCTFFCVKDPRELDIERRQARTEEPPLPNKDPKQEQDFREDSLQIPGEGLSKAEQLVHAKEKIVQRFDAPFAPSSHQQGETHTQFSLAIKQGIIEAVRELEGVTNLHLSRRRLLQQTFPFLLGVSDILFDASVNEITDPLAHAIFEKQLAALWDMYHTGGTLQADYQLNLLFEHVNQKHASEVLCMSYQLWGSLSRDKMKFDDAHILYQKAFEVAKELNDVELMASAFARKGVTCIQQDVATTALEYLNEAQRLIKDSSFPCLSGYTLQALSEAHALAQQPYESEQYIEMAQQALTARGQYRERTHCQANTTSVTAQRGVNAVHLHNYTAAITLIDQGIENYSPTLVRGRARLKTQQSEAHYRLGDIDACCQSATEAWVLARAADSKRIFAQLRKLQIDLVTSPWKKEASVLDLNWVMTTL